jgi:hypothetical protein
MNSKVIPFLGVLLFSAAGIIAPLNLVAQETNATPEPAAEKKSASETEADVTRAIKDVYPDATVGKLKKAKSEGTNDVYSVEFTSKGARMTADVVQDGTILEVEEPGDISTFPAAANAAVRKAITGMGIKDNGVRVGHTYAEIRKDDSGEPTVVKLAEPLTTYRADVANNLGTPGKFSFKADGSVVDRPAWAK